MAIPTTISKSKSFISKKFECTECGGKEPVLTHMGVTCASCGLVIERSISFGIHPDFNERECLSSSARFFPNAPTLVGTARERFLTTTVKLGIIQERMVTSAGVKRSRVYHLVNGAINFLDLPSILVEHSMKEYERVRILIPRKTAMTKTSMLAAIAIINASRRLNVVIYRDKLLDFLGIQGTTFKHLMVRILSLDNKILVPIDHNVDMRKIVGRVVSTFHSCVDTQETDITRLATEIFSIMASHLLGMREDIKIAVLSYVLLKKLWPDFASLSRLAEYLHCRISSIYNALMRVFDRMGMGTSKSLSQRDISRYIDVLLERGKK